MSCTVCFVICYGLFDKIVFQCIGLFYFNVLTIPFLILSVELSGHENSSARMKYPLKCNTLHMLLFVDVNSPPGTTVSKPNSIVGRKKCKDRSQLLPYNPTCFSFWLCSQIWLLLAVCSLKSSFFAPSVWICSTNQSPLHVGTTSAGTAYKDTGRALICRNAPCASKSSAGGLSSKLTPSYRRWLLGSRIH